MKWIIFKLHAGIINFVVIFDVNILSFKFISCEVKCNLFTLETILEASPYLLLATFENLFSLLSVSFLQVFHGKEHVQSTSGEV